MLESDPGERAVLQVALAHLGYRVVAVADLTTALACLRQTGFPVRLALVAECLPDAAGVEAVRRLRSRQADLPCLLLTGTAEGPEGVLLLPRPFTFVELAHAVGQAVPPR